ncbi:FadR/GntR family transcriptional regulator [Silvimonas amylolytica]|uniref:GntR family transcriptional regulator n=1 Tax=Silvimonas amylolytica TaxID=449663 RepID=A0ABQ2PMY5_9NEIS|nr:FadR/GntR family transcriptional regulator [Silvimonas amylolytica]GGP26771.1 GntR family transcriptional regulator [Silvimonas amylolytica]
MDLPTLKVERLYRQISSLIIQYIKDGRFKVGEALPAERDLARQLGVGRSSVREALIALEIAGWVEIRTGTGVFVLAAEEPVVAVQGADVTSATALLEARSLFEGDLAALAAERASPAQIAALGLLLDEMAREDEENAAFHDSDRRFHWLIAEMTGNEVLQEMSQTLWNKRYSPLFQQLENHYGVVPWASHVVEEHRAIHAAIAAHDPGAARAAMQRHLDQVLEKLFRQS